MDSTRYGPPRDARRTLGDRAGARTVGNYCFVRERERPSGLGIVIRPLDDELDHVDSREANAAKVRTLVAEGFETGVVLIHDLRDDVRAGRGANQKSVTPVTNHHNSTAQPRSSNRRFTGLGYHNERVALEARVR